MGVSTLRRGGIPRVRCGANERGDRGLGVVIRATKSRSFQRMRPTLRWYPTRSHAARMSVALFPSPKPAIPLPGSPEIQTDPLPRNMSSGLGVIDRSVRPLLSSHEAAEVGSRDAAKQLVHLDVPSQQVIGVGKAFASPPSEPCWRFSRTRLSSRWFPHRGRLARYRTVDNVNSKKLRERSDPSLTPLPAPTPCVPSV